LAFAAWRQQEHKPAFSDRTRSLFVVALVHGLVAAFLT
jgi:hypothetical protein